MLSQQGEMDDAVKRLQRAAGINPEEKAIKQELARAVQKRDHMKEKEKAMYRRMVEGKPSTKSDKSKPKQGAPSWVSLTTQSYGNFEGINFRGMTLRNTCMT